MLSPEIISYKSSTEWSQQTVLSVLCICIIIITMKEKETMKKRNIGMVEGGIRKWENGLILILN